MFSVNSELFFTTFVENISHPKISLYLTLCDTTSTMLREFYVSVKYICKKKKVSWPDMLAVQAMRQQSNQYKVKCDIHNPESIHSRNILNTELLWVKQCVIGEHNMKKVE